MNTHANSFVIGTAVINTHQSPSHLLPPVMADRQLAFDVPVRQPQRQAYTISDEIQELNQTTAMMEQGRAKEPCSVPQALS
jgi:hypothetical protein